MTTPTADLRQDLLVRFRTLAVVMLVSVLLLALTSPASAQPSNDNFSPAAAVPLPGPTSASAPDSTVGATSEPGEPLHAGVGSNSIWTGAENTSGRVLRVNLTITQADFDTVIAAYTGNRVDALTEVTSNDDVAPGSPLSAISFDIAPGQKVYVAYAGFQGQTGTFNLTVDVTEAQGTREAGAVGSGQPVDAALAVAAGDQAGTADAVVLGRSDNFADNLGGSVLAKIARGPLLLNPTDQLDSRVRDEILRQLPARRANCNDLASRGEAEVYLLGGQAALAATVEGQLQAEGLCVARLAGGSRVETSIAVAGQVERILANRNTPSTFPYLIARADNPVDSAAGGAYGARFDTPILVTGSDSLHPAVANYLAGGTSEVILLGGTAALSQNVENQIRDIASPQGAGVLRFAGASRDDTARVIAQDFVNRANAVGAQPGDDSVNLVNGFQTDTWVFALTAAAAFTGPVVYVQTDDVLSTTRSFLQSNAPLDVFAFGNISLVSDATLNEAATAAS